MPAELSEKGQELLADLPIGADDPTIQAIVDSLARELGRVEDAANVIRAGFLPHTATDASRMLGLWEMLVGVPVEPPGVLDAERRGKVLASLRKRRAAKASDWVALLTEAIGSENWEHAEVAPYSVTILLPHAQGTYTSAQVEALAQQITPANLEITALYDQGFVLGYSQVGVSHL